MMHGQPTIEAIPPTDRNEDDQPKREFLKRKRPIYVPPK